MTFLKLWRNAYNNAPLIVQNAQSAGRFLNHTARCLVCFLSFFGAVGLNLRRYCNVFCIILLLGRGKDAEGVIAALDIAQIL